MSIITEEMIEKAILVHKQRPAGLPPYDKQRLRAALTAVLPDIVETCAKECEDEIARQAHAGRLVLDAIPGAIRALAEKDKP